MCMTLHECMNTKLLMQSLTDPCARIILQVSALSAHTHTPVGNMFFPSGGTSPFQSTSWKPFKTYIQRSQVYTRSLLLIPSFRHLFLITFYLLLTCTSVSKLHPHLGVTLQFLGVKQPISNQKSSPEMPFFLTSCKRHWQFYGKCSGVGDWPLIIQHEIFTKKTDRGKQYIVNFQGKQSYL